MHVTGISMYPIVIDPFCLHLCGKRKPEYLERNHDFRSLMKK